MVIQHPFYGQQFKLNAFEEIHVVHPNKHSLTMKLRSGTTRSDCATDLATARSNNMG